MLGIVVLGSATYAAFIALHGLWAVPLLATRHDVNLIHSGHIVLAGALAAAVVAFCVRPAPRRVRQE